MASRDRFKVRLECPICGATAIGEMVQNDGPAFFRDKSTQIAHLPEGFKVSNGGGLYAQDKSIFCGKCDVLAEKM